MQNIFQYSNKRDPTKDIKVKRLLKVNNLRVRLILNTDGAIVRNQRANLHIQSGLLSQIYLLFCGQNLKILLYVVYGMERAMRPGLPFFNITKMNLIKLLNCLTNLFHTLYRWKQFFLLPISSAKVMCYI